MEAFSIRAMSSLEKNNMKKQYYSEISYKNIPNP